MKETRNGGKSPTGLDRLIDEIVGDVHGDDEQASQSSHALRGSWISLPRRPPSFGGAREARG